MSYTTDIAAQRLSDRGWRLRHSAWLLAPILGWGMFSFIGYFYCAFRVKSAKWWRIAAIVGVLTTIGWVLAFTQTNEAGETSDAMGAYLVILWIGLIIWGLILNRDYLRWRAGQTKETAWYSQPAGGQTLQGQAPPPPMPSQAPSTPPGLQGFTGVTTNDYYAPRAAAESSPPSPPAEQPPPAQRPDLNRATAEELVSALAIDPAVAQKVLRARETNGGFQTVDDLTTLAGLQPHEFVSFRDRVVVGPRRQPPPRGGRILDY